MTSKINVFKILDSEIKKQNLYPKEIIIFATTLLAQIGKAFDAREKLDIQFNNLKKSEYETLLKFLIEDITNNEFDDKDSSEKYIFSKILEDYIFVNLDTFFNYNMYMNKERRDIKNKIDSSLCYIYNLEESNSIHPGELHLDIEGKKITKEKDVYEYGRKKTKKNKKGIILNNLRYEEIFFG